MSAGATSSAPSEPPVKALNNEFTVHETMIWNIVMQAFLYKPETQGMDSEHDGVRERNRRNSRRID